jgi:hypothetical protein
MDSRARALRQLRPSVSHAQQLEGPKIWQDRLAPVAVASGAFGLSSSFLLPHCPIHVAA